MRRWQIVGFAVGLLVASVLVVVGLTLFVLPGDTFDGPRGAIEGVEDEGEDGNGGEEGDAGTDTEDGETDGETEPGGADTDGGG